MNQVTKYEVDFCTFSPTPSGLEPQSRGHLISIGKVVCVELLFWPQQILNQLTWEIDGGGFDRRQNSAEESRQTDQGEREREQGLQYMNSTLRSREGWKTWRCVCVCVLWGERGVRDAESDGARQQGEAASLCVYVRGVVCEQRDAVMSL